MVVNAKNNALKVTEDLADIIKKLIMKVESLEDLKFIFDKKNKVVEVVIESPR